MPSENERSYNDRNDRNHNGLRHFILDPKSSIKTYIADALTEDSSDEEIQNNSNWNYGPYSSSQQNLAYQNSGNPYHSSGAPYGPPGIPELSSGPSSYAGPYTQGVQPGAPQTINASQPLIAPQPVAPQPTPTPAFSDLSYQGSIGSQDVSSKSTETRVAHLQVPNSLQGDKVSVDIAIHSKGREDHLEQQRPSSSLSNYGPNSYARPSFSESRYTPSPAFIEPQPRYNLSAPPSFSATQSATRMYHQWIVEFETWKHLFFAAKIQPKHKDLSPIAGRLKSLSRDIWSLRSSQPSEFNVESEIAQQSIVAFWKEEYELWTDILDILYDPIQVERDKQMDKQNGYLKLAGLKPASKKKKKAAGKKAASVGAEAKPKKAAKVAKPAKAAASKSTKAAKPAAKKAAK